MLTTVSDLDNLEFKIIKEQWNEYELKDGTKIRGRIFLTRISENKNTPRPQNLKPGEQVVDYQFQIQNHFEVFTPKNLLGIPTLPLPAVNEISESMKELVESLTYNEPWNTYEIIKNGTIIKVKLVVNDIYKVKDKYDALGNPYYLLINGPLFDVKPNTSKQKFA